MAVVALALFSVAQVIHIVNMAQAGAAPAPAPAWVAQIAAWYIGAYVALLAGSLVACAGLLWRRTLLGGAATLAAVALLVIPTASLLVRLLHDPDYETVRTGWTSLALLAGAGGVLLAAPWVVRWRRLAAGLIGLAAAARLAAHLLFWLAGVEGPLAWVWVVWECLIVAGLAATAGAFLLPRPWTRRAAVAGWGVFLVWPIVWVVGRTFSHEPVGGRLDLVSAALLVEVVAGLVLLAAVLADLLSADLARRDRLPASA